MEYVYCMPIIVVAMANNNYYLGYMLKCIFIYSLLFCITPIIFTKKYSLPVNEM